MVRSWCWTLLRSLRRDQSGGCRTDLIEVVLQLAVLRRRCGSGHRQCMVGIRLAGQGRSDWLAAVEVIGNVVRIDKRIECRLNVPCDGGWKLVGREIDLGGLDDAIGYGKRVVRARVEGVCSAGVN